MHSDAQATKDELAALLDREAASLKEIERLNTEFAGHQRNYEQNMDSSDLEETPLKAEAAKLTSDSRDASPPSACRGGANTTHVAIQPNKGSPGGNSSESGNSSDRGANNELGPDEESGRGNNVLVNSSGAESDTGANLRTPPLADAEYHSHSDHNRIADAQQYLDRTSSAGINRGSNSREAELEDMVRLLQGRLQEEEHAHNNLKHKHTQLQKQVIPPTSAHALHVGTTAWG